MGGYKTQGLTSKSFKESGVGHLRLFKDMKGYNIEELKHNYKPNSLSFL